MSYRDLFYSQHVQEKAKDICEIAHECWRLGLSDTTGFSISCRVEEDIILTDKTGTGFRRNKISPQDLVLIDLDANFLYVPQEDGRMAPVNVVIHLEGFKSSDARACVHWHDPYTNAFTCLASDIHPFTLQSKLIGTVECIIVDDYKEKERNDEKYRRLIVPSGLHCRQDVYGVMRDVGTGVGEVLSRRNDEFAQHGIVVTHFEHGLFAFGRNLWEAFDNGYRSVRNAQTIIFSKMLQE